MHRTIFLVFLLSLSLAAHSPAVASAQAEDGELKAETFKGLALRGIYPRRSSDACVYQEQTQGRVG